MSDKIGIIHEIGDLGLGFDPISNKQQNVVNKNEKDKDNSKDSKSRK